jgi:hypothetical protein
LKQQIAEKEIQKQRELMAKKQEEEKEQERIEKERELLRQKYAKEKEEARIKEEQERIENERQAELKREKERLVAEAINKSQQESQNLGKVSNIPKPQISELEYPPIVENFRSNSPPLPAVQKQLQNEKRKTSGPITDPNTNLISNNELAQPVNEPVTENDFSSAQLLRQLSEIQQVNAFKLGIAKRRSENSARATNGKFLYEQD